MNYKGFVDFINSITKTKIYNLLVLILSPILIYFCVELLNGSEIILEKRRCMLNFIFIYIFILMFFAITDNFKFSIIISYISLLFLALVNYFVVSLRGTPFVPWDILSLRVALSVMPTYKLQITSNFIKAILIALLNLLLLIKTNFQINNKYISLLSRGFALILSLSFIFSFYTNPKCIEYFKLDDNWEPRTEYRNNGLIASLFKQSRNFIVSEPEGYSKETIATIVQNLKIPLKVFNADNPNIIVIMNESFSDLKVISDFETNEDYLPFYRSLNENTMKGNLHVSVFGAGTPNTEWEFLTSNSMAFVPYGTVPYQQYVIRKSSSLATILSDQGYTPVAFHCYYPNGYNRNLAYPLLGFKTFLHIDNVDNLNILREYPDDLSTYKKVIDLYENKKSYEKLFTFTVTMQNHSSYDYEEFENTIYLSDTENYYPKLNQYLSLIKESDNAFKYLVEYFSNVDEPTIILMYGDHQPYVEDEFYNELLSDYESPDSKEILEKKYITPFILWANYDIEEANNIEISANYLAGLLLDTANLKTTPYINFLNQLRAYIPIITGNGYMDKDGIYHDFYEENEYSELINKYKLLQYNNVFDRTNRITELFEVNFEE